MEGGRGAARWVRGLRLRQGAQPRRPAAAVQPTRHCCRAARSQADSSMLRQNAHLATGVLVPAISSSVVTMPGDRLCTPILLRPSLRSSDCGGTHREWQDVGAEAVP